MIPIVYCENSHAQFSGENVVTWNLPTELN